ncbi:uncharacterized protein A4U43_UnF4210 [Asparagus officinalis]|uniref:O-methyltransferase domain-containing protein n=1 Tax=Asparagus officinalis TaxID=4686 RepID=A0A1R3L6W8_ASPOF|nr:trans-resveratrol di-O-methyltransferase-like [Asparagus officinalis]ONK55367.1 uncharacterized protein A4U43_UnF4210 [Asparagus officinalis]
MSNRTPIPTSKELLEAQNHLWNQIFSFMNSFSLKCAVELGIADAVHDHGDPITISDLATALNIPSCRLHNFRRFMSLMTHNGFFRQSTSENGETTYSLTRNASLLIKQKGESITPFIELALYQPLLDPWQHLSSWFKCETPSTAFELCHGMYIWGATGEMPGLAKTVSDGLDSDSAAVARVIVDDCGDQFEGVKSLVEVAGNKGKIALEIKKKFPEIKCSLFELPHVIDALEKSEDIEYVAGDMFEGIPAADVLILKSVLVTWNDEECVNILQRCKEAIPNKINGGKVIIIDKVIDANIELPKFNETQIYFDMHMMVHVTGKQRTENEWKKLFTEAGFKECKITPALGIRCIIEISY